MHVAFFDLQSSMRLHRLMKCIRRSGRHKVTLLTCDVNLAGPQWEGLCDQVIDERPALLRRRPHYIRRLYRGWLKQIEMHRVAKVVRQLDCDLWHVFGMSNEYARAVIESARCPVIYDAYDFAGIYMGVESLRNAERRAERYCLENANAIVTKFPDEVLDYFRGLGYQLPKRILHFQDYCDERNWLPIMADREHPREWHLVQGGGASPIHRRREEFGYEQFHDVARVLAAQGIHFHLYPSPTLIPILHQFQCYRTLAAQEPLFHFHDPLPFPKFRELLPSYHWGAWIHPPWAPSLLRQYWYGIGNKLTVYAEAGLPLVVNNELLFGSRIVRDAAIGLTFEWKDVDRLRAMLDNTDWRHIQQNLADFRNEFSIERQWPRLMAFYQETIELGRR